MAFEGNTSILGQVFPRQPRRWYQRPGRKHASGTADWHCYSKADRRVARAIADCTASGVGIRSLAKTLAGLLQSGPTGR